jgi:hypothetical protein
MRLGREMEFEKIKFEHLQFTRAKEPHPVANFRMLLTAEHVETLGYSALMNGTVVKDQFGDIPIPFKIDSALIYLPDPVNPDSTDRYPADAVKGLKLYGAFPGHFSVRLGRFTP